MSSVNQDKEEEGSELEIEPASTSVGPGSISNTPKKEEILRQLKELNISNNSTSAADGNDAGTGTRRKSKKEKTVKELKKELRLKLKNNPSPHSSGAARVKTAAAAADDDDEEVEAANNGEGTSRTKGSTIEKENIPAKILPFQYYVMCDFEATCDEDTGFTFASEIIEFPAILMGLTSNVDTTSPGGVEQVEGASSTKWSLETLSTFHSYVRPTFSPILSEFCIKLTGISQEVVDKADPFHTVYKDFKAWLTLHTTSPSSPTSSSSFKNVKFVTDGPWDVRDFLSKEFQYHSYVRPLFLDKVVDLRKLFMDVYVEKGWMSQGGGKKGSGGGGGGRRKCFSLNEMLDFLSLSFEGRQHSGIDDSKNIGRIFQRLVEDNLLSSSTADGKVAEEEERKREFILSQLEGNLDLRKHKPTNGPWKQMRKKIVD